MLTGADIVQQARQILLTDGWTQNMEYDSQTGRRCLLGGIQYVYAEGRTEGIEPNAADIAFGAVSIECYARLSNMAWGERYPAFTAIPNFNDLDATDQQQTTLTDVLDVLDEATLLAKEYPEVCMAFVAYTEQERQRWQTLSHDQDDDTDSVQCGLWQFNTTPPKSGTYASGTSYYLPTGDALTALIEQAAETAAKLYGADSTVVRWDT